MTNKYAIIVAGGSGHRMGTGIPKQFLLLQNRPVLWHTLSAFHEAYEDLRFILVLPELYLEEGRAIAASTSFPEQISVVTGGATRFQSVDNGLKHVPGNCIVAVHDGVRCLLTPQLIRRCFAETEVWGNAIPAISPVDSMRIETPGGYEVLDRDRVRLIQTPQTFFSDVLKQAFLQGYHQSFTDEAIVAQKYGARIHLVEGEANNIKITHQIDLVVAEKVLEDRWRAQTNDAIKE